MNADNKHAELDAYIESLGLTCNAIFIPQSASRNSGEKNPTLNWRISIIRRTSAHSDSVMSVDYSQGIGHVPDYLSFVSSKDSMEKRRARALQDQSAERGTYPAISGPKFGMMYAGQSWMARSEKRLPPPLLRDVLYGLVIDSDVLNADSFEDWASNYGYDTDSRKAEQTYEACRKIARDVERVIGREALAKLQELFQDH